MSARITLQKHLYYIFLSFMLFVYILMVLVIKNTQIPSEDLSNGCEKLKPSSSFNSKNSTYYSLDISSVGEEFDFDEDILALVHIQKTGGSSWENHIYNHLFIKRNSNAWEKACVFVPRRERYYCTTNKHNMAIFNDRYKSRYCDIHADYTELKNCFMYEYKNRISSSALPTLKGIAHFITFLRDPIHRYISEYEYVKKELATWSKAIRVCVHMPIYSNKCYNGDTWNNVTWEEFLTCDYNLANNRQTRMLANYNILGCDVLKCWTKPSNCSSNMKKFYEQKILQSAKHTLISLAYFGLTEYQQLSEYLFLKTFNEDKFKFSESMTTNKKTNAQKAMETDAAEYIEKIKENNHLDIQLYQFAKDLFFKRVSYFQRKDEGLL